METTINKDSFVYALTGLLYTLPYGTYHPTDLRMRLGMSRTQWSEMIRSFVYPRGSTGRRLLNRVGVEIVESVIEDASGRTHRVSNFSKVRRVRGLTIGSR